MSEEVSFVHGSGGLVATALLAGLRRERASDPLADAGGFALPDGEPPSAKDLAEQVDLALTTLAARWDALSDEIDQMDTSRLRERWLIPLLRELGFSPVFMRGLSVPAGRYGVSHLGWEGGGAPPMLLAPGDLDAKRNGGRGTHDELQALLNASDVHRWGIAANSRRLRLLRDFHHRRTRGYVEFDLDAIFESKSYPDFLCLFRLCHASRFPSRDGDKELLEQLYERSLDAGVAVGQRLRPQVQRALETIANGVATPELKESLSDPARARAFHRELLVLLYRLLFLLFAERRRLLPPTGLYAESYSVTRLRELAGQGGHAVEPRRSDLWEGLKVTFGALAGDGAEAIGAFPFNGPLFEEERTSTLSQARCENRALLRAIRAFTTVELEGVRQYVNFADLGVEEIGSVYESLLDFLPTVVEGGRIELLETSEERSDLGSYYTPRELVDLVLTKSLDKVIEERLAETSDDPADRERALLDITVVDPACGSAAFLIAAVDRLATALAEVRREGGFGAGDEQTARRDVLQRCIYAVDKDETAVELAKVALWIHCAVKDRPLTFLDHRIQHGDSLVGWPLLGPLPHRIPDEAFESKSSDSREEKNARKGWLKLNQRAEQLETDGHEPPPRPDPHLELPPLVEADEQDPEAVRAKAAAYGAWRESPEVRTLERAADIWTGAFLWRVEAATAPTTREYWQALKGETVEQAAEVARLTEHVPFFHWALRFPEIREAGGFDCVIGNPPWEQFESREQEWFASREPTVAGLPGAQRKAAIAALQETDPDLHASWRRYITTNDRMGEWVRRCGRFTASGGKPNTYLLFAEHVADILRPAGRAGVLLKSAFALDESASRIFRRLVDARRVEELHDVINGGSIGGHRVFPNVAAVERFSIVRLGGGDRGDEGFEATVMNWNLEEAATRLPRRFDSRTLATLNPRTRTLTSFRRNEELLVALDVHERLPTLDFEKGENLWELSYATLFNSTTDSDKFLRREELESNDKPWVLGRDKVFRRGDEEALPVYEGQLVNRYDHRAKSYERYSGPNKYGRKPAVPETTDDEKSDPTFEMEPRYWMRRDIAVARLAARAGDGAIFAFRDVGAVWTNRRSSRGALIGLLPATHVLPIFAVPVHFALEFAGLLNSTVFDFLVRGHMPAGHVALTWMLSQIAVPAPGLDARISSNAERLSLTSQSVADVFGTEPHLWDPDERYWLDVETDALVAHAYSLDRQAYEIVLDSFEVMARMQATEHGYYKLKEDCLAAFERLGANAAQEVEVGPA